MYNLKIMFCALWSVFYLGCTSCEDQPDSTITIVNNSEKDILWYLEYRNPTDTLFPIYSLFPTKENIQIQLISSGSSKSFLGSWKVLFKELETKVAMLFLFSRDTVEQVPWNQIRDKYMVLRRYDLTLDILEQKDWKIVYP